MIKLFAPNTIDFTTNGITILTNALELEIVEELNGSYTLNFKYPIEEPKIVKGTMQANKNIITSKSTIVGTKTNINLHPKSYFLQEDYIVYANKQAFRIYNVKKDMSMITINCRHIFYDLLDNFLEDCRPTNLSRIDALNWVLSGTQYPNNFTASGNIGPTSTRYFVRKNPVEAIMGQESILETWGGEIVRDNFNIEIWDNRGNDRGVLIQGGKNLLGIEEDLNTDNVVTRIMPTGLDENDTVIMLPEKYIDSPYINIYPHPKIKHMHYGDIKVNKETNITKDDVIRLLRLKVKELYEVEKVDIPEVNYKIDFIELSKTDQYKDYISLERVEVGDTVTIRYDKTNLDIKAKVIKTNKKLKGKMWVNEKVELGNFKKDVSNSLNKIDNITTDDGKVKGEAIWGPIDAAKATLKAMSDSAETQVERAILFEDKDPTSPTYGALCMGTRGFQIASSMTNGEWQWATFGTGKGFTADLISAGILKSLDGSLRIDLGNGSFTTYNKNQFPAIELNAMNADFYDFRTRGKKVGTVYTNYDGAQTDQLGFTIGHYSDYNMSVIYEKREDDKKVPYVLFDKYKTLQTSKEPVTLYEEINATWGTLNYYDGDTKVGMLGNRGSSLRMAYLGNGNMIRFGRQSDSDFVSTIDIQDPNNSQYRRGCLIWSHTQIGGNLLVTGDFAVNGSKNCIVDTKNYGKRLINAYETMGYYYGDLGEGRTDENGECICEIEDMVIEIMNSKVTYHITLTEMCSDDLTIEEMRALCPLRVTKKTPNYFIIRGEPNMSFSWELKGKRLGYENSRADLYDHNDGIDDYQRPVEFDVYNNKVEDLEDRLLVNEDNVEDILLGGDFK